MFSPMLLLLLWFWVYALPAIAAGIVALALSLKTKTVKLGTLVIHIGLLVSITASQYVIYSYDLSFPWAIDETSVLLLGVSVAIAMYLIGISGFVYALSSFAQEITMLSVAFLLLPVFSVWQVILLIVPLYVVLHFLSLSMWLLRLVLLTLWGVTAILIFNATNNIYIVIALHTALGAFLISQSLLLSWTPKHKI